MGRVDVRAIRYLEWEHFRVLNAVEMGMRNHELVPLQLIGSIGRMDGGTVRRVLVELCKHRMIIRERGKRYDGYRLTTVGNDMLALRTLCARKIVEWIGNQIGIGKESDILVGGDSMRNDLVVKFHRLGRTSFRKLKEKRDYHKNGKSCSWLHLSSLAAAKEFAFLKALHQHKFPVPRPIDVCRHLVVMDLITGLTLCNVHHVKNVEGLYEELMTIIVRMARYGLIHGDFNEFNIMLTEKEEPVLIDLPQMVSIDHPNAQFYFERDVNCIRSFFRRRFNYESDLYPKFEGITRKYSVDVEVNASGFTPHMAKAYNEAVERAREEEDDNSSTVTDEDNNSSENSMGSQRSTDESSGKIPSDGHNNRLNEWIRDVQDEMEKLDFNAFPVFDDCACSEDEKLREVAAIDCCESTSKDSEKNEPSSSSLMKDEEKQTAVHVQYRTGTRSIFSTRSTIAPKVVRKRVVAEMKAKQRRPLRVKGKASASDRLRKTNAYVIKEYSDGDF